MTIQEIGAERIKRLVHRCFPEPERSFLINEAAYLHSYEVHFEHSEIEMFFALAKGMGSFFSRSVTISLFDEGCEQEDCEKIEDCLSRRSSFHETHMAGRSGSSGMITVLAAIIESPRMQSIDFFTNLL